MLGIKIGKISLIQRFKIKCSDSYRLPVIKANENSFLFGGIIFQKRRGKILSE